MPNSPFDTDDTKVEPLPKRARRPWWRWNVITLASTLFVLVWIRELLSMGNWMVGLTVGSIFILWLILPTFIVPTWVTTMANDSGVASGTVSSVNRLLIGIKVVAIILCFFCLLQFLFNLWIFLQFFVQYGLNNRAYAQGGFLTMTSILSTPILGLAASASLFCLAEIALRLTPIGPSVILSEHDPPAPLS